MATLVVLGAGDLGGAAARQAVALAVTRQVVLVDDAADVARGKALDIQQAAAIDGVAVSVSGTSDLGVVVGAAAIVLADRSGVSAAEHQGDAALRLIAQVRALNAKALIVCAGATQLDLVERAVRELGADATRLAGSAPEALRQGLVALVSLAAGSDPRAVSMLLLGRPPDRSVVAWNDASIGGRRVADVLNPPAVARLEARLPYLWPPGPLTLGAAAVGVVHTALTNGPANPCLFIVPPAPGGGRGNGVVLPTAVSSHGLTPRWPALSPRDQMRLDTALAG
ncbi:MAG: hypothetical protein ABI880_05730 [Acidobacteriota bacterium]